MPKRCKKHNIENFSTSVANHTHIQSEKETRELKFFCVFKMHVIYHVSAKAAMAKSSACP